MPRDEQARPSDATRQVIQRFLSDWEGLRRRLRGGFFGGFWVTIAAVLVLIGMIRDDNALTLIGLLALITAGVAWGWTAAALRRLVVDASLSRERALPGDIVTLTVQIANRKVLLVPWLTAELEISNGLEVLGREAIASGLTGRQFVRLATTLAPFGKLTWRVRMRCHQRGVHPVGPIHLRAGDPFGFFTDQLDVSRALAVLVYPRVVPMPVLLSPRELAGDHRVRRQVTTDPARIVGVRDYQPSDPFRMIHWKASARLGNLQVRVEEPVSSQRAMVCVNLETFAHYWEGVDLPLAERMIAAAASAVTWCDEAGYAVGVAANGLLPGTDRPLSIPPARNPGHLIECLGGLARVGVVSTVPFLRVLQAQSDYLARGGAIILIASRLPDHADQALGMLVASGRRAVLVPVADFDIPPIRGLTVRRINADLLDPDSTGVDTAGEAAPIRADGSPSTPSVVDEPTSPAALT